MSRTAEILQKALDELGATTEEEAPSRTEFLLAESIMLAKLTKAAGRISISEFVELFEEMKERYKLTGNLFAYHSVLALWNMVDGDMGNSRETALKAYKQLQLTLADLTVPEAR